MRLSNSDTDIEACFTCSILLAELERIGVSIKTNHETVWASITSLQDQMETIQGQVETVLQQQRTQSDMSQSQASPTEASSDLFAQSSPRRARLLSLQTHIDALIQQKPAQSGVSQIQASKSKASPELFAQDLPRQAKPPRPSLPHPERFTGNKSLGAWDAAIRSKLAVDGQAIGSTKAQFYYVYLHLDNYYQTLVLPQVTLALTSGVYDYKVILSDLVSVIRPPEDQEKDYFRSLGIDSESI
jgi:hypothetical protein